MSNPVIPLWSEKVPGLDSKIDQPAPFLKAFRLESKEPHSAVIVCPGGSYMKKAEHEGVKVALWLNSIGISAFVLEYRVAPYRHPWPLTDARRAVRLVRSKAKEWNLLEDKIGMLGFSAGGHLAGCAGTFCEDTHPHPSDSVDQVSARPDALILCYPVITFGELGNPFSMSNLLGENPSLESRGQLSLEDHVTPKNPPTFLWHTAEDKGIVVEHSLLMASALRKHGVPFALHVFEKGGHGMGLASKDPDVGQWKNVCASWLTIQGFTTSN